MTNTRSRKLTPALPYIFLHCPDAAPVDTIPTAVTWGCCDIATSELHYICGDDRVVINRGGTGFYEIVACVCVEKASGAPTHSIVQLYVNGTYVCCSDAHGIIGTAGQHTSANLSYTIYLNEGDYVQIYLYQDAGTGTVEDDTGRFCMKGLPMEGWNNRSGGYRKSQKRVL